MDRFYSRKHTHTHFTKYYDFQVIQAKEHSFSISIQGSLV